MKKTAPVQLYKHFKELDKIEEEARSENNGTEGITARREAEVTASASDWVVQRCCSRVEWVVGLAVSWINGRDFWVECLAGGVLGYWWVGCFSGGGRYFFIFWLWWGWDLLGSGSGVMAGFLVLEIIMTAIFFLVWFGWADLVVVEVCGCGWLFMLRQIWSGFERIGRFDTKSM